MNHIEVMKIALDALNNTDTHPISSAEQYFKETQAMEALEDAIKDAEEQKPICKDDLQIEIGKREWVGLTDEEIEAIQYDSDTEVEYELFDEGDYGTEINIYPENFARAIEAKLKEKNK
jgi:non-homologous end joining protein Ku